MLPPPPLGHRQTAPEGERTTTRPAEGSRGSEEGGLHASSSLRNSFDEELRLAGAPPPPSVRKRGDSITRLLDSIPILNVIQSFEQTNDSSESIEVSQDDKVTTNSMPAPRAPPPSPIKAPTPQQPPPSVPVSKDASTRALRYGSPKPYVRPSDADATTNATVNTNADANANAISSSSSSSAFQPAPHQQHLRSAPPSAQPYQSFYGPDAAAGVNSPQNLPTIYSSHELTNLGMRDRGKNASSSASSSSNSADHPSEVDPFISHTGSSGIMDEEDNYGTRRMVVLGVDLTGLSKQVRIPSSCVRLSL